MCFSAEASFGASILLTGIGIATLKNVKKKNQYLFAAVPILFALQQFIEGLLWYSASNPEYALWQHYLTYLFLIIALSIWPVWISFSIWMLEKNRQRKKILSAIAFFGLCLSVYLSWCLATYKVFSSVAYCHVAYKVDFPFYTLWLGSVAYLIPTVFSLLISSIKSVRSLGLVILLSYLFTKIFYSEFIVSVWCFFAAILSILIYSIINKANRPEEKKEWDKGIFILFLSKAII